MPRTRLMGVLATKVAAKDFLGLVAVVIEGQRGRGLRQGGSLSPLLLNVYLDHFLDRPWEKMHRGWPLIRVADDLMILTRDRQEARGAREGLLDLLRPAGMPLKGSAETATRHLAQGEDATWLGYRVRQAAGRLEARLPREGRWWDKLDEALTECHDEPESPIRALETIEGWIDALGPCYRQEDVRDTHQGIDRIARHHAFEETLSREEDEARWAKAHARWGRTRDEVDEEVAGVGLAAPPADISESS